MKTFFKISLCILFLVEIASSQDTIIYHDIPEITIDGKRAVPERFNELEGASLYSSKKNEIVRLSNIDANLVSNNTRQLFARVPGLTIWENDGSGLQVAIGARGLNPNRSWEFNTRQNGYDISSDIFGYPEAYYNPPMEAVEKIQLVRGGASLQFGSQFGGLLNYVLKRESKGKPFSFQSQNTFGSYGLLNSFNALGGSFKTFSYYVYHHYRKANGWRENGQYEVRNTHGYINFQLSKKSNLSVEFTNMDNEVQQSGGLTDLQYLENHRQSFRKRNWFSTPWNLGSIQWNYQINSHFLLNTKVFGLIGERNSIGFVQMPDIKDTINSSLQDYNYRQVDRDKYKNVGVEIRSVYKYSISNIVQHLGFGIRLYQANTVRKQKGKGDTGVNYNTHILTEKFPTELSFQTHNLAAFVEHQFKINQQFSITPGFRYESLLSDISGRLTTIGVNEVHLIPTETRRQFLLAGLGLEYKFSSSNLYTNISQAYRPILFSDITPPSTTDIIDPDLKDAAGFTADLGYRGSYSDLLNFDFSVFYMHYNNRIGTIRKFIDNDPAKNSYQYRTNLGESSHKGIELYADISLSKLFHLNPKIGNINTFASISFIHAQYLDFISTKISGTAPNIIISQTNLKNNRLEYAPESIHNIGLTYSIKGFSTTLQLRISSEVYSDASNTKLSNNTGTTGKIDGYKVLDLSFDYHFLKIYSLRGSINNLGDTQYATRRAGGYPGPGLIPGEGITFTLGIGVKI